MMKNKFGKFINNRYKRKSGKIQNRYFIHVPTWIAEDKDFPLKEGDMVKITTTISDYYEDVLEISKVEEK